MSDRADGEKATTVGDTPNAPKVSKEEIRWMVVSSRSNGDTQRRKRNV
jgi:hypothetical protein